MVSFVKILPPFEINKLALAFHTHRTVAHTDVSPLVLRENSSASWSTNFEYCSRTMGTVYFVTPDNSGAQVQNGQVWA
jgi:hypothetical protein